MGSLPSGDERNWGLTPRDVSHETMKNYREERWRALLESARREFETTLEKISFDVGILQARHLPENADATRVEVEFVLDEIFTLLLVGKYPLAKANALLEGIKSEMEAALPREVQRNRSTNSRLPKKIIAAATTRHAGGRAGKGASKRPRKTQNREKGGSPKSIAPGKHST